MRLRRQRNLDYSTAIDFDLFVFHPLIIIGGLTATIVINVSQIYRSRMQRGGLDRTLLFSENWENLAIVLSAFVLMIVIALYLLAENFRVFAA